VSGVKLEGNILFGYDRDALKKVLRKEGREIKKAGQRLVSRNAVSKAGEYPGLTTGYLHDTIKTKLASGGMAIIITHVLGKNEDRYPFILAHGALSTGLEPRKDYMLVAINQRRDQTIRALRGAFKQALKPI